MAKKAKNERIGFIKYLKLVIQGRIFSLDFFRSHWGFIASVVFLFCLSIANRYVCQTKLQTIRRVVLPMAFPNIITGLILSIGRVSGETAPILFTVAAYFLPQLPGSIFDQCMALPYHLYVISTSGTDIEASRGMAYGTALVLIAIVLIVNLLANALRGYFARKVKMN